MDGWQGYTYTHNSQAESDMFSPQKKKERNRKKERKKKSNYERVFFNLKIL